MTLPSSGAISMQALATEFGQALTVPLESYYSGHGIVASGAANGTSVLIPSSGAISLANFYGVSAFTAHSNVITATGLTTFTIPAGASTVLIEVWGPGGGSGAGGGSGCGAHGGGGGGGGGYSKLSVSVAGPGGQTIKCNV